MMAFSISSKRNYDLMSKMDDFFQIVEAKARNIKN